jgi:hypothetical protein
MKEWVTLKEAGVLAERATWTISRWIKEGRLEAHKFGPSICVRSGAVLKVEAELRMKTNREGH